jgi:clan AA aspartic protease (TIGR02281 family)
MNNGGRLPRFLVVVVASGHLITDPATAQNPVVLKSAEGLFHTRVVLNNSLYAPAIIDTGSSSVGICSPMAERLQLLPLANVAIETAGGTLIGQRVLLQSVKIGSIILHDVAAVVHPPGQWCTEVLIGLSGLKKLSAMMLRGQRLTLFGPRKSAERNNR